MGRGNCPYCDEEISDRACICPYCQQGIKPKSTVDRIAGIIGYSIVVIVILIWLLLSVGD